eukprot:2158002-Amphidinium_carterae.3
MIDYNKLTHELRELYDIFGDFKKGTSVTSLGYCSRLQARELTRRPLQPREGQGKQDLQREQICLKRARLGQQRDDKQPQNSQQHRPEARQSQFSHTTRVTRVRSHRVSEIPIHRNFAKNWRLFYLLVTHTMLLNLQLQQQLQLAVAKELERKDIE